MTVPRRATGPLMQLDLALALILTAGAFAATVLGLPIIVRLPLVSFLVLFVPGFGLLSAAVIGPGLAVLERVMIAIIVSICLTIVCGLVLAVLGIPIERMSWVYVLSAVSVVGLVGAWYRRWRNGIEGPRPALARTQWRQTALVVIAILVVANVVAASRIIASDQFGSPPEQLWLIGGSDPYTADLGMRAGPAGGAYRVVVSSGTVVVHEYDISLDPSATWDTQLTFTPDQRTQAIVASLYQGDSQIEDRYVDLQALPSNGP